MKLVVASILAVALTLSPVQAFDGDDWLVFLVEAGPQGATEVELRYAWLAEGDGTSELRTSSHVWGVRGQSGGTTSHFTDDGPHRIATSRDAGGTDTEVELGNAEVRMYNSRREAYGDLDPGERLAVAEFVTGLSYTEVSARVTATGGNATLSVMRGSGSRVLRAVEREDDGVAVAAESTGAGSVSRTVEPGSGVVGAFVDICTRCEKTWRSPDGRWRRYVTTAVCAAHSCLSDPIGNGSFAGPDGPWTFGWTGLDGPDGSSTYNGHSPAMGAYAPVGDLWPLFAG